MDSLLTQAVIKDGGNRAPFYKVLKKILRVSWGHRRAVGGDVYEGHQEGDVKDRVNTRHILR